MTLPGADTGALLVTGATSGAGKSTVAAALGRVLNRRGVSVAPFKAQNMSNHAAVTADGGEIGRAQATQASACGVDFDRRMNPILLKPVAGHRSHLVVMGDEVAIRQFGQSTSNNEGGPTTAELKPVVLNALRSLRSDVDWVVAEGAGGAAEINLLDRDLVNLPLARAAGMKAVLVVDIDRGGAYASAFGSIELMPPELKATIGGVLFNRFRGDTEVLESGNREFERRTGVPILGVLPTLEPPPLLGVEDSLDVPPGTMPLNFMLGPGGRRSRQPVRVAAVRLPHLANPSDLEPFTVEPDVSMRWAVQPDDLTDADMVVLPGSRATVEDLDWLITSGMADRLSHVTANGGVVVGVCGGFQMLGRSINDDIESGRGVVRGLGFLDVDTVFQTPKVVRRSTGRVTGLPVGPVANQKVEGYQIRWGRPAGGQPWLDVDGEPEGAINNTGDTLVLGTSLHGLFDNDSFRSGLLSFAAARTGRTYEPSPVTLGDAVDAQHNRLADWLTENARVEALLELASQAAQAGDEPGW